MVPLENQRISPTQMLYNEQTSSGDVKDAVKDMRQQLQCIDR